MLDVQERVARLEGRVEGHAQMVTDAAGAVRHLEARMEQRFTALESRMLALDEKLDRKTDALDARIGGVESRLAQRLDSQFRWLVGIQFAMLVALVASLVAIAG
jgi:hypothetical protein